jgi:hypothetical protein
MSTRWLSLPLALVVALPAGAAQKPTAKPAAATCSGTVTGRSGKPLAKAWLLLAQVAGDEFDQYTKVKLGGELPSTVTDANGKFQFKGCTPGVYTIVYQPGGAPPVMPAEIGIKSLAAGTPSTMPLMKRIEIGSGENYPPRAWGNLYTLMKGHTFWAQGEHMKLWNATVRRNPRGPYLEVRKGVIWTQKIGPKSDIKFDAWSF